MLLNFIFFAVAQASTSTPPPLSCSGVGSSFAIYTQQLEYTTPSRLWAPYFGANNTPIVYNPSNPSEPFRIGLDNEIAPAIFELRSDCSLYYAGRRVNTYNNGIVQYPRNGAWTLNPIATNVPDPSVVDSTATGTSNITALSFSYNAQTGNLTVLQAGANGNTVSFFQDYIWTGYGFSTSQRPPTVYDVKVQTFKATSLQPATVEASVFSLKRYVPGPGLPLLVLSFGRRQNQIALAVGTETIKFTLNKNLNLVQNGQIAQIPKAGGAGIWASTVQSGYDPLIVSFKEAGGLIARLNTVSLGRVFFNGDSSSVDNGYASVTLSNVTTQDYASILDFAIYLA